MFDLAKFTHDAFPARTIFSHLHQKVVKTLLSSTRCDQKSSRKISPDLDFALFKKNNKTTFSVTPR